MDITIGQLTSQLENSGILVPGKLAATRERAGLTDDHASAKTLAKLLVKEGHLTKFQAQLAFGGKAKNLVMGSYVVLEKLGEGGMGQVFKARHKRMKREVALKILAPQFTKDAGALQRFHREVEAAARLNHQNIVTAFDADEVRGTHYLVMEYVRGYDLSQIVKKSGPLSVYKAVNYVMQAATGLAYAHEQNVVHRDIKPSNLLLDDSGTVKILDMGLARFDEASTDADQAAALTGTGMLMGTVDYMSPEQAMDSKTADHRSDTYSLGCTLFLLITGKPMYTGDTMMKRVMAHQTAAIPQLPIDDSRLQLIFEKMVAKKSADRFQSTSDVVSELNSWLLDHRDQASLQVTTEMPLQPESSSISPRTGLLADSTEGEAVQAPAVAKSESVSDTSPSSSVYEATVLPGQPPSDPADANPIRERQAAQNSAAVSPQTVDVAAIAIETVDEPLLPSQRRASRRKGKAKATLDTPTSKSGGGLFGNRKLLLAGGGLAVVILLGALIFRLTGKDGTVVEMDGPLDVVTVEIDDKEASAMPDGTDMPLTPQTPLTKTDAVLVESVNLTASKTELKPLKLLSPTNEPSPLAKQETWESLGTADAGQLFADNRRGLTETLPKPSMTLPPPENISAESTTATASSKAGTLAPLELRTQPRAASLPKYQNTLRSGQPLGEFAAVSHPGKVNDILSWSVEPVLHRGSFRSVDVGKDGMIATGGHDGAVRLWTNDWQLIKVLPGHANSVVCVQFSPNGEMLASVSSAPRDMLAVWDVNSGQLLNFHDVNNWTGHLAWLPDGSKILHAGSPKIELIAPLTGERTVAEETQMGQFVSFSPDGARFVLNGEKGDGVKIFETKSLKLLKEIDYRDDVSVDWSGNGKWIAVGRSSGVDILDTRSFQNRQTLAAAGFARFSADSTGLAVTGNSVATVFNTSDWSQRFKGGGSVGAYEFTWTHDSQSIITPHATLNANTGDALSHFNHAAIPHVSTAVTVDGLRAATATEQHLRIWNGEHGELISEYSIPRLVNHQLLWQPDGKHLLRVNSQAADSPGRLTLIDSDNGTVAHELVGHQGNIWRACWSPDGRQIASVGEDGVCRIWDAASGQENRTLVHDDPLWWVQWAHDGSKIATGSAFSAISVWGAKDGKLIREFKTLSEPMQSPRGLPAADGPFCFMQNGNQLSYMAGDVGFEVLDIKTGQITSLGQVEQIGGNRLSAAWSKDFGQLGIYGGYREFHLYQAGEKKPVTSIRYITSPHWMADGRRILGGDNYAAWISGYDLRRRRRLGVLMPELPDDAWATLSSDGQFVGSDNVEQHVVFVALHADGRLNTYSASEFAETFGWKNDPKKVKFLK